MKEPVGVIGALCPDVTTVAGAGVLHGARDRDGQPRDPQRV